MFERYTETAQRILVRSRQQAMASGSREIEPAHLLVSILGEANDLAAALVADEQRLEEFRRGIEGRQTKGETIWTTGHPRMSRESKMALAYAAEEADRLKQHNIGPGHLLLGLLRSHALPADTLAEYGVTLESVRQYVRRHVPLAG